MDVSLGHNVPPLGLGNGAATVDHEERRVDIIPQKEPYFPPPGRRVRHQKTKVWINSRPRLDKKVHTAQHRRFRV
jgi:hypothetical protein